MTTLPPPPLPGAGPAGRWRDGGSSALRSLAWLVAVGPLVVVPGLVDFARLPQQAFVQLFALALVLWWVLAGRPESCSGWSWRSPDGPVLAFLAISAVSLSGSIDDQAGLLLLLHWACCALVYLLVSRTLSEESDAGRLALGLLVGGGLVALVGLAQATGGLHLVPQAAGPSSTMANRNVAAGYLVMVAPLALLAWHGGGRLRRLVALVALAAIGSYLPFTLSRLAAVAVAAQLLVLTAVAARRLAGGGARVGRGPRLLALAAAAMVALFSLAAGIGWISAHDSSKGRSLEVRADLAGTAIRMFRQHPLRGVGLGSFGAHFPRQGPAVRAAAGAPALAVESPHSEPLQVLAETGMGGGVALLWLGATILMGVVRLRRASSPGVRRLGLAVGLAFLGLALDVGAGFPLRTPIAPLAAATLLGILAAFEARVPSRARDFGGFRVSFGVRRAVAATTVAALLLASGVWSLRRLSADRALFELRAALSEGSFQRAAALGRDAVRSSPRNPSLALAFARACLRVGQPLAAAVVLDRLRSHRPWDVALLGTLGLARREAGQPRLAASLFQDVLEIDPSNVQAKQALEGVGGRAEGEESCPPGVDVTVRTSGSLDLEADGALLADILACLRDRAGLGLEFDGSAPERRLSVALRDQPLAALLESLLEGLDIDYLLTYDPEGGQVERLIIVSSSGSSVRPSAPEPRRARPRGPTPGGGAVSTPPSLPEGAEAGGEWGDNWVEDPAGEDFESEDSEPYPDFPEPEELSPMTLRLPPAPVSPRVRRPSAA